MTEQEKTEEHPSECCSCESSGLLPVITLTAIAAFAGFLFIVSKAGKRSPSLKDLRMAYSGLAPEEMD